MNWLYVERNGIHSCNTITLSISIVKDHIFIYCTKHYTGIDSSPYTKSIYSISYIPFHARVYKSYAPSLLALTN